MSETKPFRLSSAGLMNINLNDSGSQDMISIVVGFHRFQLHKMLAEFISPAISHICASDPTFSEFVFDFSKVCIDFNQFTSDESSDDNASIGSYDYSVLENDEDFCQRLEYLITCLSHGEEIQLNQSDCDALRFASKVLKNEELYQALHELFPFELNIDNCFTLLKIHPNDTYIIRYIAQHFFEFNKPGMFDEFLSLPPKSLHKILTNESLTIKDEDSLLDLILYLQDKMEKGLFSFKKEINISDLLETIHFEALSEDKFQEFVTNFDISFITSQLWFNISKCFHTKKSDSYSTSPDRYKMHNFPFSEKNVKEDPQARFNGIFQHLKEKVGGNVHDKGAVIVSSSSCNNGMPSYSLDFDNKERIFQSENANNSWLCFDFQQRMIRPTHYSIRSRSDCNYHHLKNWIVEGSNDGESWNILDERVNEESLDDQNAENTFLVTKSKDNYYRYLRLQLTGLDSSNKHYLTLSAIEFFGDISKRIQ